jgi:lysophospholipase L1-like esterase
LTSEPLVRSFYGVIRGPAPRSIAVLATLLGLSLAAHAPAVAQQVDAAVDASVPTDAAPTWPLDDHGHPIFGVDIPIEDPSGTALHAFHAALARAGSGQGQARIVFYGASHVAADIYTSTIRHLLQSQFGDAGHGFVMPVEPWPRYHAADLDVTSNYRHWDILRVHAGDTVPQLYGVMGVTLTTEERAWGRIDTESEPASRFELWYAERPDGGTIDVLVDGHLDRRLNTRSDSPTPQYATFTTEDRPHTFEIRARGDGAITVYGATVERERPGVVVDTMGINGARAAGQLLWNADLQAEQLRRRMPDLVVLAYGTNESGDDDQPIADYETAVRAVVARVQSAVPGASCLLVGPSDRPIMHRDGTAEPRPRTAQVVEVQRRVAHDYGCGFYDLVAFGGGPMHMVQWAAATPPWAQSDHVHFTARGYTRLGEAMANALMTGYTGPGAL